MRASGPGEWDSRAGLTDRGLQCGFDPGVGMERGWPLRAGMATERDRRPQGGGKRVIGETPGDDRDRAPGRGLPRRAGAGPGTGR